jgi:Ni,Fe-hydrogenase I cytochrome b subunit
MKHYVIICILNGLVVLSLFLLQLYQLQSCAGSTPFILVQKNIAVIFFRAGGQLIIFLLKKIAVVERCTAEE